jgi:hypothetical protein
MHFIMNARTLITSLGFAALASGAFAQAPAAALRLEPQLYIFRTADFRSITVAGRPLPDERRALAVTSPAELAFDDARLTLEQTAYRWSAPGLPPQFNTVAAPMIGITFGRPAALLSEMPAQYFEKRADGTFVLRETPRNSSEIPRYQITFRVDPVDATARTLRIAADAEIATVRSREKLPGVDLDVGKPVTATFKEHLEYVAGAGDWTALLLRSPNGSDYSALLLARVAPGSATASAAAPAPAQPAGDPNAPARIEVTFEKPEDFTDASDGMRGSSLGREDNLDQLRAYLVRRAPTYLQNGQTLQITVTDVDLAGEIEPWRIAHGAQDVRIVKEIYPPRIKLRFRLTDATGSVVKEGERNLAGLGFMMTQRPFETEARHYEFNLLDDWLHTEFGRPRKK